MTEKRHSKSTPSPSGAARTKRLEQELRELREADTAKSQLLELLGRITARHTVDDICRATVEGVRELLGFERCGLFLREGGAGLFRGTFGTDMFLRTTDERAYTLDVAPGSHQDQIIQGAIVMRGCELGAPLEMPGEEGIKADLVGLRAGGRLYGILSVDNRLSRRPITDSQLAHLLLMSEVLGNAIEISRARVALAQSEERFRQVAEKSGEWIWELDGNGRYVYSSPVVKTILGHTPEELVGRSLLEWVTVEDRTVMLADLTRALSNKAEITRRVHHQVHREGFPVILETSGVPILDAEGRLTGYRGVHRDVTRERDLESQLRHSQKIDAIGRLAGGIAHDFNNLLTAILGCGSLLLEDLPANSPARRDVESIRAAGERAAALTRQLLAFSRRQVLHVAPVNVAEILHEMEKLLGRTLGEDIELVTEVAPDLEPIESDADQLQQVILHLAINARDAMTDPHFMARATAASRDEIGQHLARMRTRPKQLTIGAANTSLDEAFCEKHVGIRPGRHIVISVRDTGIGMPKEVREHLFEPFFTTKEVGHGSGLGLSTVYGIVQQMGGFIKVESELGVGSVFMIYLPLAPSRASAPKPAKRESPDSLRGQEQILVVEDEEVVRDLTVRMLQTLGYQTLQASNGAEALDICRGHSEPIHLILTDMVMPHMSGREFVDELRRVRGGFKVLFVSGYGSEDAVSGMAIGPDTPLIQKPFTRDSLARKIREVLDNP
jgi:two-component system, cell cycle sensor histidine kinase and response regulator CckA